MGALRLAGVDLARLPELHGGDVVACPHCGGRHPVARGMYGAAATDTLLYHRCGDDLYLAGVCGRNVMALFPALAGRDPQRLEQGS